MEKDETTVVWFRRDLRIEDNPALASAAKEGRVVPVFVWCPEEEGQFCPGRVSRWWLKQSLAHLSHSLRSLGAELVLMKSQSTLEALLEVLTASGASKVVFNHLYDPVSLVRDHGLKEKLVELGFSVKSFNGDLLFEPWEVYDDENGSAFTTFETYWQKCLRMPMEPVLLLPPWKLSPVTGAGTAPTRSIDDLGLEDASEKSSNALLGRAWSPGWSSANKTLSEFIDKHLHNYSTSRLTLGGDNTSQLSPYLHFGELSVRKAFQAAIMKQISWRKEGDAAGEESARLFLRAIGLREYSRYLCFNFPFTHERSLLSNLKFFPWRPDAARFKDWRQGRTGYPLVDAGMRELWATGWIHNRIRVIVSSFCVKVLLIPWRWGMKYFWDTLLDADLESDILGWQYISGSLPDGHELERLDSPELQGSQFDPEGQYVRQWLPELTRLPTEWIHHPWDAPATVLRASGVELGLNYPSPIVDIDDARDFLTEAIFRMWEAQAAERAKAPDSNDEEVVDNSDRLGTHPPIPTVVVKGKVPCHTYSSNDQKVPSFHRPKAEPPSRKRLKSVMEEERLPKVEEDVCSTAESSAAKKRVVTEGESSSFYVPESVSMSIGAAEQECESSEAVRPERERVDGEGGSGNTGFENTFCGEAFSTDPIVQPQHISHERERV